MPRRYITRTTGTAGITAAVNTFTNLATDPDGASAGAVTVPGDVSKLEKVLVCIAASAETSTDSGGCFTLRLSGNGLRDGGQQDIVVGGQTSIAQGTPATGIFNSERVVEFLLDLDVVKNNTITPALAYNGVDMGTPQAAVTLVFK